MSSLTPRQRELYKLAEEITGTCRSLDEVMEDYDELADMEEDEVELWLELNTDVKLCNQCGWWSDDCEETEDGDGPYCQQCQEENE